MRLIEDQEKDIVNEPSSTGNYTSSLTQQVYMLIQQVQQLTTRLDRLEEEFRANKNKA